MSFSLPGQRSSGQGVGRGRVLEGTEDSPCDTGPSRSTGLGRQVGSSREPTLLAGWPDREPGTGLSPPGRSGPRRRASRLWRPLLEAAA